VSCIGPNDAGPHSFPAVIFVLEGCIFRGPESTTSFPIIFLVCLAQVEVDKVNAKLKAKVSWLATALWVTSDIKRVT
jgi:hypothetical protein